MNGHHRDLFLAVLLTSFLLINSALILLVPLDGNAATGNSSSSLSPDIPHTVYGVQVVASLREEGARRMAEELRKKGYSPEIYSIEDNVGRVWNVVLIGLYDRVSEARHGAELYREKEKASTIVKAFDPLLLKSQRIKILSGEVDAVKPMSLKQSASLTAERAYYLQVAAFVNEGSALNIARKLERKGYSPNIYSLVDSKNQTWFVVLIGAYETISKAENEANNYRKEEGENPLIKSFDPEVLKRQRIGTPSEDIAAETTAFMGDNTPEPKDAGVVAAVSEDIIEAPVDGGVADENAVEKDEEEIIGDGDDEALDDEDEEELGSDDEEAKVELSYSGFIELENYFSTDSNQDFGDANKKNEIRNRLEVKYGTDETYLFTVSDIYFIPAFIDDDLGKDYYYSQDSGVSRNLRISTNKSELRFDELYINYSKGNFRLRAGNQIYGWGTADAFNATSYFNPYDIRELIFKDDDEWKVGVPSVSSMIFTERFTLEMVFVPVHVPMNAFTEDTFWSIDYLDESYPVIFGTTHGLDVKGKNYGFGGRLSASIKGVDVSLSGYHGPDREPVFLPTRTVLIPNEPIALLIEPRYYVISMAGFDVTTIFMDDFVVQLEAAYSPNKRGFVKQDLTDYQDIEFPFEVKESHYISYAVGFNYFIPLNKLIEDHEGESVFTFEWFQSKYFESELYPPFITDIMTCRYEDSYYDSRVKFKVTGIFEMENGGTIFWPEVGYDFQNGFTAYLSYANIEADKGSSWEDNSLFYYFRDNDIVIWRLRYEY
ncbi:MAG: SPOR domain-containing protein [Syntrophobacterales bacterium]|nr:MAG: SPOR domain-containing protein [Syntrophobacterales bacterium]